MFAHIVLVSKRVMNTGKKIIAGVLVAGTLLVGMGDRLITQAGDLFERAQSDSQSDLASSNYPPIDPTVKLNLGEVGEFQSAPCLDHHHWHVEPHGAFVGTHEGHQQR